jgi:hypothetical protein
MRPLLETLRAVGRVDLSVGRLYEGHCNALQLVAQFGTDAQFSQTALDTAAGHMFAVWNTQGAHGIDLLDGDAGPVLDGEKTYCWGVGHISRPIVTVSPDREDGPWMCLLRGDELPLKADASAWTPLGMAASVSGAVRLADVAIRPDDLIGAPGDYQRQPWFSGGAIRFAAVQLGGAEALLDETIAHLRRTGRDPWRFASSAYEAAKYEDTLKALGNVRYDSAFEIGCSIGVLTRQLAARCASLLSVDISPLALAQAVERNADLPHVHFERMEFPNEAPEGSFDLILMSEVGYYLSMPDLDRAAQRCRDLLRTEGALLLVHYVRETDYP